MRSATRNGPRALAFQHDSHELAVAALNGLFVGAHTQMLHVGKDVIALEFTQANRKLVTAGESGDLVAFTLSDFSSAWANCGCVPNGLFRVAGSAFRFTLRGEFQLFDADAGQILAVPLRAEEASEVRQ